MVNVHTKNIEMQQHSGKYCINLNRKLAICDIVVGWDNRRRIIMLLFLTITTEFPANSGQNSIKREHFCDKSAAHRNCNAKSLI